MYDYGNNQVIKFSLLYYFLGRKAAGKARQDYELCKKYLENFVLETDIAVSASGRHVVHIQPKIVGRPLMRKDLEDIGIKNQFAELMRRYSVMVDSEKCHIDLIGREGVFTGGLTNIFIIDSGELRIIDATVLELSATGWFTPLFYLLREGVVWRQGANLRKFMASGIY